MYLILNYNKKNKTNFVNKLLPAQNLNTYILYYIIIGRYHLLYYYWFRRENKFEKYKIHSKTIKYMD